VAATASQSTSTIAISRLPLPSFTLFHKTQISVTFVAIRAFPSTIATHASANASVQELVLTLQWLLSVTHSVVVCVLPKGTTLTVLHSNIGVTKHVVVNVERSAVPRVQLKI
jgi:hypothetical protein